MGNYQLADAGSAALDLECLQEPEILEHEDQEPEGLQDQGDESDAESDAELEIKGEAPEQPSDAFKLYLRDIQRTKLLSAEEERALAIRIEQGDKSARDLMITSNLRLVVKIAKRYLNRGLPFLDLIEEGNLGLIKAVGRFEVSKGFRFSTYATWWIRQSVDRALMNQAHTIRLPVHVAEGISKLYRVTHRFRDEMNRDPTTAELAQALEVDESQVRRLRVLMMKTYSIDQPIGEYSDFSLADTLEDTSTLSPVDQIDGHHAYERVSVLLQHFSEAEQKILTLRFGLDDNEPQTLEAIGRSFGLTRERIRQIESGSLLKLRRLMGSRDDMVAYC
jgi:RNA polymerase primary sigma factor